MFLVCTVLSNLYMATFAKTSRKKSRLPALYLVVSRTCRIRIFRAVYALYSAARIFVLKRRNRTENRHRGIDISPVCGIFRSAARSFIPLFEMQTENGRNRVFAAFVLGGGNRALPSLYAGGIRRRFAFSAVVLRRRHERSVGDSCGVCAFRSRRRMRRSARKIFSFRRGGDGVCARRKTSCGIRPDSLVFSFRHYGKRICGFCGFSCAVGALRTSPVARLFIASAVAS